jgi:acyl-CoA synthetase (AMP-forming)/AMP-acid ligase II
MGSEVLSAARVLEPALARNPDHEALVTASTRLSYGQLDALAHRAAHALAEMGVEPGDAVCASLPNEHDVVVAFHGAMRLGAVWVGINRVLAAPEKRHIVADCSGVLLLSDDVAPLGDGEPPDPPVVDLSSWRAALEAAPATPWNGTDPDPLAPAGIAYTSGTTGRPKGAVHSQHNLMLPGAVLVETRRYGPDLRKGDCFAFTILNMAVLTTLLVSQAGGTSVVMDRTDPEGLAEWIEREGITTWNGAPAMLHGLATHDAVTPARLASLDEVWVGGADCPEAIRRAFTARFGLPVLATYGLSEAPTVVAIDDRPRRRHEPPDRPDGSSGRPLPHLRVRIAGPDGATVAPGEPGQICISAADHRWRPMLGYLGLPGATNEVVVDGELRTGDVGAMSEDGHLHVRDRLSLVIIRGGANVYPAEVERVIADFPGIAASAVVAIADERLGERVGALVEMVSGAELDRDALAEHLRAHLAGYKVPERIVVVESLPRNAMGKIVRTGLAGRFAEPPSGGATA